ncbi:hypothetical protein GCM10008933_35030 [Paenibacillus motobuensis]|uniref:Uncharacterized protein n=1 Tax=Paenibacillus motobuensis TaxID=295324 RepID=A0ABP3IFW2_9BACL
MAPLLRPYLLIVKHTVILPGLPPSNSEYKYVLTNDNDYQYL